MLQLTYPCFPISKTHSPAPPVLLPFSLLLATLEPWSTFFISYPRTAPFNASASPPDLPPRGTREQTREQIGTVTLYVGDGETPNSFLDDVETRFRKLRDNELQRSTVELTSIPSLMGFEWFLCELRICVVVVMFWDNVISITVLLHLYNTLEGTGDTPLWKLPGKKEEWIVSLPHLSPTWPEKW